MPILEYVCHACGNGFEKLIRSMTGDQPKVVCPSCGASDVHKQFSTFGVAGAEPRGGIVPGAGSHGHTHAPGVT